MIDLTDEYKPLYYVCLEDWCDEINQVTVRTVDEVDGEEFYNNDLVCIGSPTLHSLPPPPVFDFLRKLEKKFRDDGLVQLPTTKLINKNALIFCTYSASSPPKAKASGGFLSVP